MVAPSVDEAALRGWLDVQAIRNVLATHSRGIDRADSRLLRSAYHPDAEVAYGFFDGPAIELCEIMGSPSEQITMHRTSNMWIRLLDHEHAVSESYAFVYSESVDDAGFGQALIGGRYLDRLEKRGGEWRISHRTYVLEWNANWPGTGSVLPDYETPINRRGSKTADDLGTRLLNESQQQLTSGDVTMTIPENLEAAVADALARQDIHDLIMAQARATDRRDRALLESIFHQGATVDAGGLFDGPAPDYCDFILEMTAPLKKMYHSVANEWIRVEGDHGVAETYVIAFTTAADEAGGDVDSLSGGRYLDRFERRDGLWKFVHRAYVMDWTMHQPTTDQSDDPDSMYASLTNRGRHWPDDPVYALWGE